MIYVVMTYDLVHFILASARSVHGGLAYIRVSSIFMPRQLYHMQCWYSPRNT